MGTQTAPRLARYLPYVAVATLVVSVMPAALVWALGASGTVTSILQLVALGVALSLALGWLGRLYWESRPGSDDLLFGELLAWGFAKRWMAERRLSSAVALFERTGAGLDGTDLDAWHQRELLEQLVDALEASDPYTNRHSRRVARYSATIAKRLGLSREEVSEVRAAAALHDVGKIQTPREILQKRSKLSDAEFAVIKRHALDGARLVHARVDQRLAQIVVHHHERLDGTGYPAAVSGETIPLGARIIAVADTFDALTSRRPYRPARTHRQALEVLRRESGTQLDPAAVRAFRRHYSGLRPLAIWTMAMSLPGRLVAPLTEKLGLATAGTAPAGQLLATAATVATMAGAIATSPPIFHGGPSSPSTAALASAETIAGSVPSGSGPVSRDKVPGRPGGGGPGSEAPPTGTGVGGESGGGGSVADPGGGGSSTNPGGGSSSSSPSGSSPDSSSGSSGGSGGGSGAATNGSNGALGNTVGNVGNTVNGTVNNVGNTVNGTVNNVGNTVNGLVGGLLGQGQHGGGH